MGKSEAKFFINLKEKGLTFKNFSQWLGGLSAYWTQTYGIPFEIFMVWVKKYSETHQSLLIQYYAYSVYLEKTEIPKKQAKTPNLTKKLDKIATM